MADKVEYIYKGAIENLQKYKDKPLVFTGKKSFELIEDYVKSALISPYFYNDFSTNPKIEEIEKAIGVIDFKPNFIIAIGGGSVIDFAKIYRFKKALDVPLIAVPTTCGTGSEATQFAVYYENQKKQSLDDVKILPDVAIVDSGLVEKNPKYLKACTSLDAYCQAIESYFACKSTKESREYARLAMELCKDNIIPYVQNGDDKSSFNMAKASNLAGKAINISRTTAAHAMSYSITTKYKIPHGHAVALNIGNLLEYNKDVDEKTLNDQRGVDFVKSRIKEIYELIGIKNAKAYFDDLFEKLEIENKRYKSDYIDPNRLKNNPRKIVDGDWEKYTNN